MARGIGAGPRRRLYTRNYFFLFWVEFTLFGVFYLLLPVVPLYIIELGGSPSTVGLIMGLMAPVAALGAPLYGLGVDRWSRKGMVAVGLAINGLGAVILPLITMPWLLLLPDLVRRIGTGAAGTGTRTAIVDISPENRRGEGLATFTTAHNLGTAIMPLAGVALMGWAGILPVAVASGALTALGLLGLIWVRETRPSRPTSKPAAESQERGARAGLLYRTVTPEAWMPAVVLLLFVVAFFGSLAFVSVLAQERGIGGFSIFFTVYGITVLGSRLVVGRLSDIYGRGTVIVPCLLLGIVAMVLLATANSLPMLLVAAVTLAVGWGSAFPTLLTLATDWSPSDRYGTTMAMMSAFFALGTAVGAMAVGYVADLWGFGAAFLMVGGLLMVALGIFLGEYRRRGLALMGRGADI